MKMIQVNTRKGQDLIHLHLFKDQNRLRYVYPLNYTDINYI